MPNSSYKYSRDPREMDTISLEEKIREVEKLPDTMPARESDEFDKGMQFMKSEVIKILKQ